MSMKMKDLPDGEHFVTLKEVQECAADRPEADGLHLYQKVLGVRPDANAIFNGRPWLIHDDCIVVLCGP